MMIEVINNKEISNRDSMRLRRYISIIKLTQNKYLSRQQIADLSENSFITLFKDLKHLEEIGLLVSKPITKSNSHLPTTYYKSAPNITEYPLDKFIPASNARMATMENKGIPLGPIGKGIKDDEPLSEPTFNKEIPNVRTIILSKACEDSPDYYKNYQAQQKLNSEERKKKLRGSNSFTGISSSMGMFNSGL